MTTAFQEALKVGKMGESRTAQFLIHKHGLNVLPVYEKEINEYKGPVLFTLDETLVAPDMFCFKNGPKGLIPFWAEVKTKSAFSFDMKSQEWVTGIDTRLYLQYLKVQGKSVVPVYLMFLQGAGEAKRHPAGKACPSGLFVGRLDFLSSRLHHRYAPMGSRVDMPTRVETRWGPAERRNDMVYWSVDHLKQLATLEEVDAAYSA